MKLVRKEIVGRRLRCVYMYFVHQHSNTVMLHVHVPCLCSANPFSSNMQTLHGKFFRETQSFD